MRMDETRPLSLDAWRRLPHLLGQVCQIRVLLILCLFRQLHTEFFFIIIVSIIDELAALDFHATITLKHDDIES